MLKRLFATFFGVSLISIGFGVAIADSRYYDDHGRYQGRVTENGRYYDEHGRYMGRAKN